MPSVPIPQPLEVMTEANSLSSPRGSVTNPPVTSTTGNSSSNTTSAPSTSPASSNSNNASTTNASTNGEANEIKDEVKVFAAELETDDEIDVNGGTLDVGGPPGDGTNNPREAEELREEKSSLVSDQPTEKAFDARFAVPGFHNAFGMSPYLFPAYATAAYATGRSPFLYGDTLSGPPPAHMGAAAMGFRPPSLYPLGPQSYSYDQMAAWHTQAQMYQQGLKPPSSYGLVSNPISPMSRFSPSSFLGHPGLSAAAAAAAAGAAGFSTGGVNSTGNGSHPHQSGLKPDYESRNSEKDSPSKIKKEPHIKKPLNAFMLYMKEMRPIVQAECTLKESAAINQILGRRWHALSKEDQSKYYEKAREARQNHMKLYPGWTARDNYAKHKKKKRRKEIVRDGAASLKKCRARYGLQQQDNWCKPCRRKKKCIRVLQQGLDGPVNNNNIHNTTNSGNADSSNSKNNVGSDMLTNGTNSTSTTNGTNNLMFSDGEDGEDDDDDDSSPGNGAASYPGSASEPSLTSPAGFSSINSLGSPSGSIASPSTPSASTTSSTSNQYKSMGFDSIAGAAGSPSSSMDWLRMINSYHPQVQRAAAVAAASNPAFGIPPPHNIPPFPTDPRDSKHPLSVSQLTGNCGGAVPTPGHPPIPHPAGTTARDG